MDSWDLNLNASASPSNQAQETARQWVRFLGMYLFILFITFQHPPCSSVQKWHLFSQTLRTFSTKLFQTLSWWRAAASAYWKNMDFFPPPPLWNVRLSMPSSPHMLSEGVRSLCKQIWTNKLSWWNRATLNRLSRGCLFMLFMSSLWWGSLYYMEWKASGQMTSGKMKVEVWPPFQTPLQLLKGWNMAADCIHLLGVQSEFNKSFEVSCQ